VYEAPNEHTAQVGVAMALYSGGAIFETLPRHLL